MQRKTFRLVFYLSVFSISLGLAQPAAAVPQYKVTPLGSLGGKTIPYSINDSGQITGHANLSNNTPDSRVFLWEENVGIQNLGISHSTLGILAINNNGQIVSKAYLTDSNGLGTIRAYLWDKGNGVQILGTHTSEARDINDAEQVVGGTYVQGGEFHAALWDKQNGMQDLGTFGGNWSAAYGINNSGQIIGQMSSTGYDYNTKAFLAQNGQATKYIVDPNGKAVTPFDINDSGKVVGYYEIGYGSRNAFLWDEENGTIDINFPNALMCEARAINNKGQIVGYAETEGVVPMEPNFYALLWENGQSYVLDQYLAPAYSDWQISMAYDINSKGQIIATGRSPEFGTTTQGVLLTPVPEPASLLLLLAGGLGIIPLKKRF